MITDNSLKTALFDWRHHHAVVKFGNLVVRRLGAKLLISDEIIERLVTCAHSEIRLSTVEHLITETKWRKDWAEEFGESLLKVIHSHFPQLKALAIATPTSDTGTAQPDVIQSADQNNGKRKYRCSKCKGEGHIGVFVSFIINSTQYQTDRTSFKAQIATAQSVSQNEQKYFMPLYRLYHCLLPLKQICQYHLPHTHTHTHIHNHNIQPFLSSSLTLLAHPL